MSDKKPYLPAPNNPYMPHDKVHNEQTQNVSIAMRILNMTDEEKGKLQT